MNFSTPTAQEILNIQDKTRANLFTWRGQFSPQLVESLLTIYGKNSSNVFDPFVGSGTTLYEAARLGMAATGIELNPAAFSFSKIYKFSNFQTKKRDKKLNIVENLMFQYIFRNTENLIESLIEMYSEIQEDQNAKNILEVLILKLDRYNDNITDKLLLNTWSKIKTTVKLLPFSEQPIACHLSDARNTRLNENRFDFVITSPPYINVFNYHQNYRRSVELLGWDVLSVAKSEIGANRKFRSNRFLTVIQYCMDMSQVFYELSRVCKNNAKLILVVGRESNVRKTAFYNAELLKTIATELLCMEFIQQQHRVFKNKFGKNIFEEILFLKVNKELQTKSINEINELARLVGLEALENALKYAPKESISDLENAIKKSGTVSNSPILTIARRDA